MGNPHLADTMGLTAQLLSEVIVNLCLCFHFLLFYSPSRSQMQGFVIRFSVFSLENIQYICDMALNFSFTALSMLRMPMMIFSSKSLGIISLIPCQIQAQNQQM